MIKMSSSSIILENKDGTQESLDFSDLKELIVQSCLSSGVTDVWIADEIAQAIEYTLISINKTDKVFVLEDINELVIKVLNETGYSYVADEFINQNIHDISKRSISKDNVLDILQKYLSIPDKSLHIIANNVTKSLDKLHIKTGNNALVIELANYYKQNLAKILPQKVAKRPHDPSHYLLTQDKIISNLQENTQLYVSNDILKIYGVSKLFPVTRISLSIVNFIQEFDIEKPVTELSLYPHLQILANQLNDIINITSKFVNKNNIPFYLMVTDMSDFAENYMNAKWPNCINECNDIISFLESYLVKPIFKLEF